MRKWEDIVKDKLEEADGTLPESVFAEFRARRDAAAVTSATKRFPLVWAVAPAVVAGLAAVLLLRKPAAPQEGIQVIQPPSAPVAVVTDSTTVGRPEQTTTLVVQTVAPKVARPSAVKTQEVIPAGNTDPGDESIIINQEQETVSPDTEVSRESSVTISSPFISDSKPAKPITMKVAPAAGIIAGGGLLAAVAAPLLGAGVMEDATPIIQGNPFDDSTMMGSGTPNNERTGHAIHYLPLKLGLSARFPVSERISITTGLDYSWYKSSFTYSLSGEKAQNAHYLGIPVRLDWTLASGKWLDVYLGGGVEGDWCIGATLAGERIAKDGFSASLLGAGGIQFNPTKHVGLYVEPQLSWTFTPGNPVFETYRTQNPLMFSLAAGLRFTIGK